MPTGPKTTTRQTSETRWIIEPQSELRLLVGSPGTANRQQPLLKTSKVWPFFVCVFVCLLCLVMLQKITDV